MSELYWISVLGNLDTMLDILIAISATMFVVCTITWAVGESDKEDWAKIFRKLTFISMICTVMFSVLSIFIPSNKELYMIYGVGTTIDYLQDNEDAKKMPEKTLQVINKCLDKYLESEGAIVEEEKIEKSKEE